jgi:hypothetical protein|tara:strand:+ start:912 stop:1175 length:264 start_codon:yes stop_codon:yes gene_type:complete
MNKKNCTIGVLIVAAIGLCVGVLPDICSPAPLPEPLVVDDAPVVELTKEISDVAVSEDTLTVEAVNEDTLVEEDSGADATDTSSESQ